MQKHIGYTSVGFIGLIAVVVFSLGWLMGTLVDTGWTFGENMLSDLGADDNPARNFFNVGCFFGGLLVMVAGIGVSSLKRYRIYASAGVLTAIAGVLLSLIGLFPTDTGDVHITFALGLFAVGTIAMIVMAIGDWKYGHVLSGGVTIILLALVAVTFALEPLAYSEAVTVIAFLIWFAMSSVKISLIKVKI